MPLARFIFTVTALCLLTTRITLAETVVGFEDPAVLKAVLSGEVTQEEVAGADDNVHFIFRAYADKATPDTMARVATSYENFPDWFKEILEAKTTTANTDRTVLTFWMDAVAKIGFIKKHAYPEGKSTYGRPLDSVSEGTLDFAITNYAEYVQGGGAHVRLIPYQGGLLVHTELQATVKGAEFLMGTIRNKVGEGGVKMLSILRGKL